MKLPDRYEETMRGLLGEQFGEYCKAFEQPPHHGLRVNTSKISCEAFEQIVPFPVQRIPWIKNGYTYPDTVQPAKHPYYFAGLYYIQEPSAMTPANRLPVRPGDRVLDLCAAPGGKATELGSKCGRGGFLLANDISASRARALLKNLELAGQGQILVTSEKPERLAGLYPEYFDKILVDAPCSGEGMFHREPTMMRYWEEHGPEYYAPLQREILDYALGMLRPGGMLLYSTCTFSPKEDEGVVQAILAAYPQLHLEAIEGYEGFSEGLYGLHKAVRIWPHNMHGEGHFLALMKKDGERAKGLPVSGICGVSPRKLPAEIQDFLKLCSCTFRDSFYLLQDKLYYLPEEYVPAQLRYLRTGLYMGEWKKKRFEPSQALAMYLKRGEFAHTVDLTAEDVRTVKYLKGETIEADSSENGYHLVCVDGYPLGWGKVQRGILKNKYYQGWRIQ